MHPLDAMPAAFLYGVLPLLVVVVVALLLHVLLNKVPVWRKRSRTRRAGWHTRLAAGHRAEAHAIAMRAGKGEEWQHHRAKAAYHAQRALELSE